ncbi:MAG: VCBS repeat-containing protein [Deltaproteobacteria bacterium]|nr:VCBS repeat-containing protein [Deltaproteobacteria bacterium]
MMNRPLFRKRAPHRPAVLAAALAALLSLAACEETRSTPPTCGPAARPGSGELEFVRNLSIGNTGWFSSPAVLDLDGNGSKEIVAPFYDVAVWSADGTLLDRTDHETHSHGRVYAPAVVADLDGDGTIEIVVASGEGHVTAYEWDAGAMALKAGWPASTCGESVCGENRSLAAADLDHDGRIEIVAATTETEDDDDASAKEEAYVYVFNPDGTPYQPAGVAWPAWPRYNKLTGPGGDADRNGCGHNAYGMYGQNLGIGNVDDDAELEVVATYDNHHIQVFNPDGTALDTDPTYFTNRSSDCRDQPLTWGQFIRYLEPQVEEDHYHLHTGDWPGPSWTYWLQWTHSPPNIADLDGDGLNEVLGFPNVEKDEPYHTYHYALMVLQGDHAATGHRSGRRLPAFERLPLSEEPWQDDDWYPVAGMPAPAVANIDGDARPEILASLNDGFLYAYDADARLLWRHNYARGAPFTFGSEPAVADLTGDGRPEVVIGVWSDEPGEGRLVILSAAGEVLHDVALRGQEENGNGVGATACPTINDIDGDGQLEILLLTLDHGLDVYRVKGSSTNCTVAGADADKYPGLWTTGRGNFLRNGLGPTGDP